MFSIVVSSKIEAFNYEVCDITVTDADDNYLEFDIAEVERAIDHLEPRSQKISLVFGFPNITERYKGGPSNSLNLREIFYGPKSLRVVLDLTEFYTGHMMVILDTYELSYVVKGHGIVRMDWEEVLKLSTGPRTRKLSQMIENMPQEYFEENAGSPFSI